MSTSQISQKKLQVITLLFITLAIAQFEDVPDDENIIMLVGPDNYYASSLTEIAEFQVHFANSAGSKDNIFIMINNYNDEYYLEQVENDRLFYGNIHDIWIRDFGTQQIGNTQYKFEYSPSYLDNWTSNWIENSYVNWLNNTDIEYQIDSIVLDGGNFTTDRINKAVITTRIFEDNPGYTESELRDYFQNQFGIEQIAFTPEEIGDITGHSDGQVFWLTSQKLAVCDYEEPYRSQIYEPLMDAFPEVDFIDMPYAPTDDVSEDGFLSIEGIYVNALQTTDNIYVPVYGIPEDELALAVFEEHTAKTIIPIYAGDVAIWGGSVHCLSWEVLRSPSFIMGDLNEDGVVDILDIVLVVNYILFEEYIESADLNMDGTLNILDIVILVNIILN